MNVNDNGAIARANTQPKFTAARARMERILADAYEAGFEVGERQENERQVVRLAELRAVGVVSKPECLDILDRLQLFRQTIGTSDSRYLMLGEIIADFARAIGSVDAEEGEP